MELFGILEKLKKIIILPIIVFETDVTHDETVEPGVLGVFCKGSLRGRVKWEPLVEDGALDALGFNFFLTPPGTLYFTETKKI